MKYNILQISDKQDDMVEGFKKIAPGEKVIHVYDMKTSLDFDTVTDSIIQSIRAQLEKTNEYLNNPHGPKDRCIAI